MLTLPNTFYPRDAVSNVWKPLQSIKDYLILSKNAKIGIPEIRPN